MEIDYVSEGFKRGAPIVNGNHRLTTSWSEVLWAAITVGRPSVGYVFAHGAAASTYEALFRWSLVRMAIDQAPADRVFRRTQAARMLDPSEKGAVSYFLGLTIAKLFAARLLAAPWLLHLDVFRPRLNAVLLGRSRPDLVGQTVAGQWLGLESKGRVSVPDADTKKEAKAQAKRITSVMGAPPAYNIGAITYFEKERLSFYWRDPTPDFDDPARIEIDVRDDDWRFYYAPALALVRDHARDPLHEPTLVRVEGADVEIGIHPFVLGHLLEHRWEAARDAAGSVKADRVGPWEYHDDGIAVVAGKSWSRPFGPLRTAE